MVRRLVLIIKQPEFDHRGEVVLGQCEPYTSGWELLLYPPNEDEEAVMPYAPPVRLLTGTFNDLRKIQKACDSIEDVEEIRERVTEMKSLMGANTETVASGSPFGNEELLESTQVLEPTQTEVVSADEQDETVFLEAPKSSEGEFFALRTQDGAVIATVGPGAEEAGVLAQKLTALLDSSPHALIVDLEQLPALPTKAVQDLIQIREQCDKSSVGFALCGMDESIDVTVKKVVGEGDMPKTFANAADALEALMNDQQH